MTEADVIQPSASIASTGPGIRYIGQHAYAFSGPFPLSTTPATMLSFTTGAGYILGTLTCCGPVEFNTPQAGGACAFQLTLNGAVVWLADTDTGEEDHPGSASIDILLPPFTQVVLQIDSNNNDADELSTAVFTGRVYGAT